jgi:two-component system response regulator YesN
MGQPFVVHLNHLRIARAQQLLVTTGKSVAEISQEVGFCHQSHFGVMFRKFVHITPTQYKRLHARSADSSDESEKSAA